MNLHARNFYYTSIESKEWGTNFYREEHLFNLIFFVTIFPQKYAMRDFVLHYLRKEKVLNSEADNRGFINDLVMIKPNS